MEYSEKDYVDFDRANELAKRVNKKGLDNAKLTNEEKIFCEKIYKKLGNSSWRSCSNCWHDLEILTSLKNQQKTKFMSEQKFQLKKNVRIQSHGLASVYTHHNMTDDVAIALLSKSESHLRSFEKVPENWKELVAGKKAEPVKVKKAPIDTGSTMEENIATTKEADKEAMKLKLEEMSKKELQVIAKQYSYPETEWQKLGKDKIINYILEKQFA